MTESESRYLTLADLGRLMRDQALVIIVCVVGCAAVAAFVASRQTTQYTAGTKLQVQDQSQALNLAGAAASPVQAPGQLAAEGASTLITPQLLGTVRNRLHLQQSVSQLRDMVSVQAESSSNLLDVSVTAPHPALAAAIANTLAEAASSSARAQTRASYARSAARLQALFQASNQRADPASKAVFDERLSQLEALASVADPLSVVSSASLPTGPSSLAPVTAGVIGAVLGALLGLVIAVWRTTRDRRLRGSSEIQNEIDVPLLGHVRDTALGYAGDLPRGNDRVSVADVEAFRMLRTNTEFLSRNGRGEVRVFAVTSPLSAEGKSTTAAALAFAYAAAGRRTLLVECDLRRPCFADRFGLRTDVGLSNFLTSQASFDDVLQSAPPAAAAPHHPNLVRNGAGTTGSNATGAISQSADNGGGVATFGARPDLVVAGRRSVRPTEELGSSAFRDFLEIAKARYEIVILDTPPLLLVADTLEVLPRVEGQIICVRSNQTTRDQLAAAVDALRRLPQKPTGLVVTGETKRDSSYGYYGGYPST